MEVVSHKKKTNEAKRVSIDLDSSPEQIATETDEVDRRGSAATGKTVYSKSDFSPAKSNKNQQKSTHRRNPLEPFSNDPTKVNYLPKE